MKKILILLTIFLIVFCFTKEAYASSASTNLINPEENTISITTSTNNTGQIKIKGTGYIDVSQDTEYFIMPTYINKTYVPDYNWRDLPFFNNSLKNNIILFDENNEPIETYTLNKKIYADGFVVGFAFVVPSDVKRVRIDELNLTSNVMSENDVNSFYNECMTNVSQAMLFIKATDIAYLPFPSSYVYNFDPSSYDISNIKFGNDLSLYNYGNNYNDVISPIIEVDKYTFSTTVDNPVTIEELTKEINLIAYDEIDGDLTSNITYDANSYLDNVLNISDVKNRVLGEYEIVFRVVDNSENSATCSIFIEVIDNQKPIVDYGSSVITYTREVYSDEVTVNDVLNNIYVTDNYSNVTSLVIEDNYSSNKDIIGEYEIKIRYSDLFGNYTDVIVSICNNDYSSPVITASKTVVDISYKDVVNINSILSSLNIEVSDNYDINPTYSITLNEYYGNESLIGTYTVTLESIDSSGNIGNLNIAINVIDDVSPVFYINKSNVVISSNTIIDVTSIKDIVSNIYNINNDSFNIEILQDNIDSTYSENRKIGVKIIFEDGSIDYKLLNIEIDEVKEAGFFNKAGLIVKKIFQFIWNIISWPFIKLFGLFF